MVKESPRGSQSERANCKAGRSSHKHMTTLAYRRTPLMKSNAEPSKIYNIITRGTPEELEEHLKNEPESIHEPGWDGTSVLHAALRRGRHGLAACKVLMRYGANPHFSEFHRKGLLHEAAFYGTNDCMELFLEKEGESKGLSSLGSIEEWVNQRDEKGCTVADCAAQEGQFDTLKILYLAGADLHCQDQRGMNLLHSAIAYARLNQNVQEMIEWLIEQGVSLRQQDRAGRVPADYIRNKPELKALIERMDLVLMEKDALEKILSESAGSTKQTDSIHSRHSIHQKDLGHNMESAKSPLELVKSLFSKPMANQEGESQSEHE